jgi:hypothetical protein
MMAPDYEEIHFKSVIDLLKHTGKITAPPGFEAELMRRINSENYGKANKVQWWEKFLISSRLIPSVAAVAVIVIFFILNFNSVERENPFLSTPKMRETLNSGNNVQLQDISRQNPGITAASLNQSFSINKEGLNFLQVRLTESERARINKLKAQVREYFKENLSLKK